MTYVHMANFDEFLKEYESKFCRCKFTFRKRKCEAVVRKIFYFQNIPMEERRVLERCTGYTLGEWECFIGEYTERMKKLGKTQYVPYPQYDI